MADQADNLRRLIGRLEAGGRRIQPPRPDRSAARRARVVAVTGGKGGVGKSSLAANLGVALVGSGRKALLVDADLGLASLDVLLGVRSGASLADVALDGLPAAQAVVSLDCGLDFLPGASGVAEMADLSPVNRQRLVEELGRLESVYDFIMVDTAAGAGQDVRAFLRTADRVLVVTTPEPTAITDAYALIKLLAGDGQKELGLAVNMARSSREGRRVGARIAEVAMRYASVKVELMGIVPNDWQMAAAVRERRPLLAGRPASSAGRALRALAARMAGWSQIRESEGQEQVASGRSGRTAGFLRQAVGL